MSLPPPVLANITLFDLGRLSRAAVSAQRTTLSTPFGPATMQELLQRSQQHATNLNTEDLDKILQDPLSKRHRLLRPGALALTCMHAGLVALCIVAVRMILG